MFFANSSCCFGLRCVPRLSCCSFITLVRLFKFYLRSCHILFALLDCPLILMLTCVFIPKHSVCNMLMCCNTLCDHTTTVLWMLIMLAFCVMHLLMQAAAVCLTDEETTEHCRRDSHSVPGHHGEHPRGGQKQESVLYKHGLQWHEGESDGKPFSTISIFSHVAYFVLPSAKIILTHIYEPAVETHIPHRSQSCGIWIDHT